MLMGEADESISSSQHHGGRISQAGEKVLNLYTNNTGVTGVRFLNAPSLKGKICWPFVVVPSGKITRGDIASSSVEMSKFCRSAIARTALRLNTDQGRYRSLRTFDIIAIKEATSCTFETMKNCLGYFAADMGQLSPESIHLFGNFHSIVRHWLL
eukprot:GHVT01100732.1.p2 GENE.GHVT01100732.1~~GHVT01100732.1.p2  ORF type:complete len:155 (-),score=4.91 GHVT01100732.1:2418-2882(-)